MYPAWLSSLALISLVAGVLCACVIAFDEFRHPQHMRIMNLVWPLTGLYASLIGLWAYFRYGRMTTEERHAAARRGRAPAGKKSELATYGIAATHCGAGCTLGDVVSELSIYAFPVVLTWFGYRTLFNHRIFAGWVLDLIAAFLFGVAFQYFTIAPMRHLSPGRGIIQALKADSLSLAAWQVGMYGWMAIATFLIFGHELDKGSPVFWFMMQIAMLLGFAASYPVNAWLVRSGIKEKM